MNRAGIWICAVSAVALDCVAGVAIYPLLRCPCWFFPTPTTLCFWSMRKGSTAGGCIERDSIWVFLVVGAIVHMALLWFWLRRRKMFSDSFLRPLISSRRP